MDRARSSLAELAAELIGHASEGRLAQGELLAEQAIRIVDTDVSQDAACVWYSVGVLAHMRGDLAGQVRAADRCLAVARVQPSPGWASCALSLRAMAHAGSGAVDSALTDLALAEVDLSLCEDDGLGNWAHTGLGYAYHELRLFELAEPHMQQAAGVVEPGPIPLAESTVIDRRNLAELHHDWADALERVVPTYATTEQVLAHRDLSRHWAGEAVLDARRRGLDSWVRACERISLCSDAALHPAPVLARLQDELAMTDVDGHRGDRARVATALARALRAAGRLDEALDVARQAVTAVSGPVDWSVEVAARHLLTQLEAQAGGPGAANGMAYASMLSAALWQQRLRTLQGARTAVHVERLLSEHADATRDARQDPLTGLGNRRALDEALRELGQATADRSPRSVVLLDVDAFKEVNDVHGHVVGDAVLCAVADALRAATLDGDLLVRLGGDEFVVLAPVTAQRGAAELLDRLDSALVATRWTDVAPGLVVTVALGASTTQDGIGAVDLVRDADVQMYQAKRARRPAGAPSPPAPVAPGF